MTDRTDYDFQDLRNRVQEKLKNKPAWGDGYEGTVGQRLIDILADMADNLSYMNERRAQEDFLTSARLRTSVVAKASENGYRPRRSIASNGTLKIELQDENGNPKPVATDGKVVLEEDSILTFDGEEFLLTETVEIRENETEAELPVVEGSRESITFDPEEEETMETGNYIVIPDFDDIAEETLVVTTAEVEYTDIRQEQDNTIASTLSFAPGRGSDPEQGAFYDVRYTHDGMRIQFGDNNFGRRPETPITVSFIRTKGSEVRVVSLNNEFQLEEAVLEDDLGLTPPNEYEYEILNVTPVVNGRGPETVEEIKINAPIAIAANQNAVNIEGYTYWAKRANIGGIIDARAFSERELDTLLYNLNNVYISYLTEEGTELTTIERQNYIDFVKERDVALAHIIPMQADEIKLGMDVSFQRNERLPVSDAELFNIISDFLTEKFERREGSIGNEFQKSDIIRDFYDVTTRSSGVNYDITEFVDLEINAYQGIEVPGRSNRVIVELDPDTTAIAGNEFVLNFDGQDVVVVVTQDDVDDNNTYSRLLFQMRDKIYEETSLVPEVFEREIEDGQFRFVLSVTTRDGLGMFEIDGSNSDLAGETVFLFRVHLVPKTFSYDSDTNIIEPETIHIVDVNEYSYFHDDGMGNWVNSQTGETTDVIRFFYNGDYDYDGDSNYDSVVFSANAIDYTTARMFLPSTLDNGSYFIRYKQDEYENFKANNQAAVTLIEPKDDFNDTVETFTKIRLL